MTNRRGFLSAILAGVTAPAVVSASSIMRVTPVIEAGTLTYKMSGRYNLDWMEEHMIEHLRAADRFLTAQPTKIIVPAWMKNQLPSGLLVATSE